MDLQNKLMLKVVVAEKEFVFLCDHDSPLGSAFDAANQFRGYIVEKINESSEKAKQQEQESVPEVAVEEKQEVENGGCCSC